MISYPKVIPLDLVYAYHAYHSYHILNYYDTLLYILFELEELELQGQNLNDARPTWILANICRSEARLILQSLILFREGSSDSFS